MFSKFKKILLTVILISFVSIGFLFAAPRPAKAQWTVFDPNLTAWEIVKDVGKKILANIMQSGVVALMNAAQSFTQKLAFDTAVYVASGGSGQKPLFDGKSFGQYISDTALNSAMTFITDFSDSTLGKYGFNVCAPSLSLIGKIKIGALGQIPGGALIAPRCDWKNFTAAWDKFGGSIGSGEVLKNFGVMFEPGQNELSFAFEFNSKVIADTQDKLSTAIAERTRSGGWQDVKNIITGKVETPAEMMKEWMSYNSIIAPSKQLDWVMQTTPTVLKEGAFAILPTMLSTFTNTLLNKTMERVMKGLFPGELFGEDTQNGINNPSDASAPVSPAVGRRAAEAIYGDFIKPRILTATNYDPLLEFTTCPERDDEKQINNCVLDDNFAAGIRLADQGKPLTVAQAIEQGYLDGGKPLISSKDAKNERNDCYQSGYCYSNLVKLRKARVLPVGWELAAEANASGVPADLNTIIDGFNKCDPATNARDDKSYKWCHMIDPNWVLRLPKTQCMAKVYGPTLASSAGNLRAETCADPVTCISQDENGNCTGGYGYCTKEKNIWRISADKCSEQFNTCLTYKARDNKVSSYIRNTVEFGICDATNVGCRPYSNNQKFGNWSMATGDAVYFNKDAEKCDAGNAGCTEFYSKASGLAYNLLLNSSFENLAGRSAVIGWSGGAGLQISTDGTNSFDGATAVNPAGDLSMANPAAIKLELNTPYTFSGYVKSSLSNATTKYRLAMFIYTDSAGQNKFNPANIISTCKIGTDNAMEISGEAAASYSRISCSFLTPNLTLYAKMLVSGSSWTDAVQLEEGSTASAYLSQGYGAVDSVFIKAAPKYLDCQAGSTDSQCANYAPTCKAEEVECERYTPKDGGPSIAGVANINDICDEKCAGYETYKQDKTFFEKEDKFPNYFIPATAKICAAPDVGCDEFTNLATEAKEYFGFIRQCVKLNDSLNPWDAFYTWEGSDTTGYQLRAHKLKVGEVQSGETGPVPAFVPDSPANPNPCNKTVFTAKIGDANYNPDCREFYNTAGKVSYRLLSRTIIATDECVEYRKTESTEPDCNNSGGVWNPGAQYCIYKGYKAESRVCASTANKCRAYSGAAASNLRIVSQDDFETGDGGWKGGTVSSEALSAGGHSFKMAPSVLAGDTIINDVTGLISANSTYTLTFWAKGTGNEKLTVKMSDAFHGAAKSDSFAIILKGDWQYFELGPIQTKLVLSANSTLQIKLESGKGFYVDNIILNEVSQKVYLIKDSWKTPAVCDQTINGLVLPQAMLGCKAYNNRSNETVYLKSFGSLCRDEAVGCGAFQDTKNSASDKNEIWNAICARSDKNGGPCQYGGKDVCSVGKNNSICRFTITDGVMPVKSYRQSDYKDFNAFQAKIASDAPAGGYLIVRDESTVEVPVDETVYLVNDKKYQCAEKDLGCSVLGQPELYSSVIPAQAGIQSIYLKNKPGDYSKILCTAEAEGCESWTSSKGADYFKSPKRTCEYKDASSGETGGWYRTGKSEACYSGFIKDGGNGIWRNADINYDGSVGMCPSAQNACTEFLDPWDVSGTNKIGRPYYLIDNDKLKGLENDPACGGKASLVGGCVLFNKTNDINLKWNAGASYFSAEQAKKLIPPVIANYQICLPDQPVGSGGGVQINYEPLIKEIYCSENKDCAQYNYQGIGFHCGNPTVAVLNSNDILKVTRDRECGEWLTCKTSYSATDPLSSKTKLVCAELGLCDKAQTGAGGSALCANFIINNPDKGKVLTADYYSNRDVSWAGKDYSGFSLGNKYPVTDVKTKDLDSSSQQDLRLYVPVQTMPSGCSCFGTPAQIVACQAACASGSSGSGYNLDGSKLTLATGEKSVCRGYPEQDSPYPSSIGTWDTMSRQLQFISAQGLKNANICEYGQEKNCECDYSKLTYGNKATVRYVDYGNRSVPTGVCQGGPYNGRACRPGVTYDENVKLSCGKPEDGGTCLKLQRQDDVIGWQGYCLERDLATPINGDKNQKACLTWLPQDIAPGQRDIYNQYRTAGYVPPYGAGKYYCLQATGNYSESTKNYFNPLLTPSDPCKCGDGLTTPGECWGSGLGGVLQTCMRNKENLGGLNDVAQAAHANAYGFVRGWINSAGFNGVGLNELWGANNADNTAGNKIYKDEIDTIKIEFVSSSQMPEVHPMPGTVFYIKPTQKIINYLGLGEMCDGVKKTDNCAGESEGSSGRLRDTNQKARSLATDKDWYFRYVYANGGAQRDYLDDDLFADNGRLSDHCWDPTLGNKLDVFQLKFNFDKTSGLLTGAQIAACEGDPLNSWNNFKLRITVRKREVCETVADLAAFKNQAYTDRLWSYNDDNKNKVKPVVVGGGGATLPYHYDYEMQPFGSANSDIAPGNTGSWYNFFAVGTPNFAGVPWSCKGNCGTSKESDNEPFIDFDPTVKSDLLSNNSGNSTTKAREYLSYLFSKIFNIFSFDDKRNYQQTSCEGSGQPESCVISAPAEQVIKYPKIFSFDPGTKIGNGYKLKEENRFLINNQSGDINITGNQFQAVMRFYFWADTNHMPIKSIKVDWGDGSVTETTDGLYKNHKPLCAGSNTEKLNVCDKDQNIVCNDTVACPSYTNVIPACAGETMGGTSGCSGTKGAVKLESQNCSANKINTFGNSSDACEEKYFELQHIYTCGNSPGQSCTPYRPTVVITDNWGIDNTFSGDLIKIAGGSTWSYGKAEGILGPATGPAITLTP